MNTHFNFSFAVPHLILISSLLVSNCASAAFLASGEDDCLFNDAYAFHFSETALMPDYTVNIVRSAINPDIRLEIINDPLKADLIFLDSYKKPNIKVCKGNSLAPGVKTIKLMKNASFPDITVLISETPLISDYKIYIQSSIFSNFEAVALFAVIWKTNRHRLPRQR